MHLLQPQPEVNTSLLVCTHSTHQNTLLPDVVQLSPWPSSKLESEQVDWLILHFNHWFSHHNVTLVRGEFEPEYFPANEHEPAKIQFAHGFFNSALHEISHWTIAGAKRRLLPDLGYWYAPDGRTKEQQDLFEQVEIKPQAIEWLFAQSFGRKFRVSLVQRYFSGEAKLPVDAARFIECICQCTRAGTALQLDEFKRELLD